VIPRSDLLMTNQPPPDRLAPRAAPMWNPFRRADPDDDPASPADRSWPTRLAWLVLVGGATALVLRCGVATVVEVHGDGMAPTLLSGDHVLLVRGTWGLVRGDLVVYDPRPPPTPPPPVKQPEPPGTREGRGLPRHDGPRQPLRNTAVVDPADIDLGDEWKAVQRRSGVTDAAPPSLRVGRILAVPGDRITFGDPEGTLGVAVNGAPLVQQAGAPLRLAIRGAGADPARPSRARPTASEAIGERRWRVLTVESGQPLRWPGMHLPADIGPVEVEADGYLIVADNRDEGACCDSRALGLVSADSIRGEIVLRLGGRNTEHPDIAPADHGLLWKP
jgi:signal peptidase I